MSALLSGDDISSGTSRSDHWRCCSESCHHPPEEEGEEVEEGAGGSGRCSSASIIGVVIVQTVGVLLSI